MKALHALYKASVNSQLLVRVDGKSIYGGLFFNRHLHGMVWFVNVLVELSSG